MDLEVREIPIQSRAMYNSRLKSYKQEVEKLEKDFVSIERPSLILIKLFKYCSHMMHLINTKPHFKVQLSKTDRWHSSCELPPS